MSPGAAPGAALERARLWLVEPLLSALFPERCPACRQFVDLPSRGPLCSGCWAGLPRHTGALCACGAPRGAAGACGRCRRGVFVDIFQKFQRTIMRHQGVILDLKIEVIPRDTQVQLVALMFP